MSSVFKKELLIFAAGAAVGISFFFNRAGLAPIQVPAYVAPEPGTAAFTTAAPTPAPTPAVAPPPTEQRESASSDEIMAQVQRLAGTDPAAAIELAQKSGRTAEEKATWVSDLAAAWAKRDPQGAWTWLQQQQPEKLRELAAGALPAIMIDAMAKADPSRLLDHLNALVNSSEVPWGVSAVESVHLSMESLVAHGQLEQARQTIEAWSRDPARPLVGEAGYLSVANALRQAGDPTGAGQWLQALPPSKERDTALVEFPAHWAQSDPAGALAWAERELPAELRARGLQRTFNDWVESDPAPASEWLGQYLARQTSGPAADPLISAAVNLAPALRQDPALGLQWAGLISDPTARSKAEAQVVLRWARQDAAAARAYLDRSSSLPPERKQQLIRKMADPAFRESEG